MQKSNGSTVILSGGGGVRGSEVPTLPKGGIKIKPLFENYGLRIKTSDSRSKNMVSKSKTKS